MMPYEAIGWTLCNTSSITAIVGASTLSRITHGTRPQSSSLSSLPAINYFELGGASRRNGIGAQTFSINCRATTAGAARDLAEKVLDVFTGSSGTGMYGTNNNFTIARASLQNDNGLIIEPDSEAFNAPVDILLVYPLDTVS